MSFQNQVRQWSLHWHDAKTGILKQIAKQEGYRQFIVPEHVGGHYSVFTPVGLLPIEVAGIDIEQFLSGAQIAEQDFSVEDISQNAAIQYALTRYELYK